MLPKIFRSKSDILLTCCLDSDHGVSGHLFELIEYFYYLRFYKRVSAEILIPFEFNIAEFKESLEKYKFTPSEVAIILDNLTILHKPRLVQANTVVFVDGIVSYRPGVHIAAKNVVLFRCARHCSWERANIVLQDSRLYDDLPNSAHYTKKILFPKFRECSTPEEKVGLIYGTRNCRELPKDFLSCNLSEYSKILVISEKPYNFGGIFTDLKPPVHGIFDLFTDYLYTPVGGYCEPFDCSPRLPAECKFYGKGFKLLAPLYRGLDVRLYDIETDFSRVQLTDKDNFIDFL